MYYRPYYTPAQQQQVDQYIAQLTEMQKKALDIARDHLGTSFDILKSSGFKAWLKKISA